LGLHRHQKERDLASGAFFEEAERPSVVLTEDFLAGSADRITDVKKKGKGFQRFGLEYSI
jgi:hypothetical protein